MVEINVGGSHITPEEARRMEGTLMQELRPDRPSMGDAISEGERQFEELRAQLELPPKPGQRLFDRLLGRLNEDYTEARRDELGELHNALAKVIAEQSASPHNVIFVLKVLEWETMRDAMQSLFPEHPMTAHLSNQPPTQIGGAAV